MADISTPSSTTVFSTPPNQIYGGNQTTVAAANTPNASVNPTGTTSAPAVYTSTPAAQVTNTALSNNANAMATAASVAAARQNMTTTYDAQGNMVRTGGVMSNGTTYQENYSPGMAGFVPNPATVQANQQQRTDLQRQLSERQQALSLATAAGYSGNQQIQYDAADNPIPVTGASTAPAAPAPAYTNPSSVTPPDSLDPTTQQGQAQWFNQDPNGFQKWAQDQHINSDSLFQVSVVAGNLKLNDILNQGNNALLQYQTGLLTNEQAQIAAIQAHWNAVIDAQKQANQSYLEFAKTSTSMTGSKYNMTASAESGQRAIATGLGAIAVWQAKEQEAIQAVQSAYLENNYKAVTANLARQEKLREDITNNLKTVNDSLVKAREDAEAQQNYLEKTKYDQITKPIQDTLAAATGNGAPDTVKTAIQNAKNPNDAIAAAGSWLQTATGDVGDYLFYQRQMKNSGKPYQDFSTWVTKQAAAKAYASAYASAQGTLAANTAVMGAGYAYVPGQNPIVDAWVNNIKNNQAKFSDVPKNLLNAVSAGLNAVGSGSDQINALTAQLKTAFSNIDPSAAAGFHGAIGTNLGENLAALTLGFVHAPRTTGGFESAGYIDKLKQFSSLLTLPNINILKGMGRVSNTEFLTLQSALTVLNPENVNMPESQFIEQYNLLSPVISKLVTEADKTQNVSTQNLNYNEVNLSPTGTTTANAFKDVIFPH